MTLLYILELVNIKKKSNTINKGSSKHLSNLINKLNGRIPNNIRPRYLGRVINKVVRITYIIFLN